MDEQALHADRQRGTRAALLLEDELLKEAFAALEAEYTAFWKDSAALDATGREKVWLAVQLVAKVRSHLVRVANDGALAAAELRSLTS